MREFADQLGVNFRFDPVLNPRIDGDLGPTHLRLSLEEAVDVEMDDPKRRAGWQQFLAKFYGSSRQTDRVFYCGAGQHSFHIDAYGGLSVCMMARWPHYDLRSGTFADGWSRFIPDVLAQQRTRNVPCSSCHLTALCDQCPGFAQMEMGDQEQPVPYLCQLAHLRAQTFEQLGLI